jgi:glycosyltransferase involved in cell wall biosynthesis
VRHRYGLSAPYILFLGTLGKRKNVPLLISAFRRLRERGYRELLLVIAGLPSNGEFEVALAAAHGELTGCVRCLGYVPEMDILPLYHGARLFVLPSMHEGFGFPLLEAMACGVPALAADNSAMRELATDEDMLCVGDAEAWSRKMEEMLFNTNLRQRLIARGFKKAREFSWQHAARATLAVYESVARNGKRATHSKAEPASIMRTANEAHRGVRRRGQSALRYWNTVHADLFDYPLQRRRFTKGC